MFASAVALLLIALALPALASDRLVLGENYPIAERDAMEEIQEKAASVDWQQTFNKPRNQWSALRSVRLPRAEEDRVRRVVPIYEAPFDVTDKDGRVIYPKGFRFNVLQYVPLKARFIVIGPHKEDIEWAKTKVRRGDYVLLSGGDPRWASALMEMPVFLLDKVSTERIQLTHVPALAYADGLEMVIEEEKIDVE